MDGNRDLAGILSRMDALDRRIRAIEEYRRMAPDMSDQALWEMRRELDQLRAPLGVPETGCRQAGTAEPDRPRAEQPVPNGYSYVWPKPSVQNAQQRDCLLLGLTAPLMILFAAVSDSLFDLPCLFPVLLCVLLFTLDRIRGTASAKLAFWLALGLAGFMAVTQSGRRMEWYSYGADMEDLRYVLLYLAACFTYLAVLGLTYAGELNRGEPSRWRPVALLGCAVLIGLTAAGGAYTAARCLLPGIGPEAMYLPRP